MSKFMDAINEARSALTAQGIKVDSRDLRNPQSIFSCIDTLHCDSTGSGPALREDVARAEAFLRAKLRNWDTHARSPETRMFESALRLLIEAVLFERDAQVARVGIAPAVSP